MTSHRFSIPARVGLEIAWAVACRFCCCWTSNTQTGKGSLDGLRDETIEGPRRRDLELGAARGNERNIVVRSGNRFKEKECR